MEIQYINRKTGEIEVETPPAEGLLRFLYGNTFGKWAVLPFAKQKMISRRYGKMMDAPSSVKKIPEFVRSLKIDMEEAAKPISEYNSFNEFFYRELKEGVRKIESGLVSPGDGRLLAFEQASAVNEFFIKGARFNLSSFLKDDELFQKHRNDAMVILRLAPNDYHRYHFPFEGRASLSKEMKGSYYSVSPIALQRTFTKVFCKNKKEVCTLSTQQHGDILVIPIAATMVGSLNATYKPDSFVSKGQEMGYFAFGGSTVVLLFDSSRFSLDADLLENTRNGIETYVLMGQQIASAV